MAKQCEIADLEKVFHDYKDMVFRTAYLILSDRDGANDAVQEVFIKVHRSWGTYDSSKGTLGTWIRRITVNQCLSQHRGKSSHSISLEELREQGFDAPDDCAEPPEERVARQEQREKILRAVGTLDRKHRAVVVLRYYDNLSYEEIAEVLNVPLGTIKSRINTAIKALREELMGRGGEV